MARPPTDAELDVLRPLLGERLQRYKRDTQAAAALVAQGKSPRSAGMDSAELAAWTCVASVLLNLDETMTRE